MNARMQMVSRRTARGRRCLRLGLVLGAVALAAPAAASAATVEVRANPDLQRSDEVHYVAGAGEANVVLVNYDGDAKGITITDPGATITAGAFCTAVDAHTARCLPRGTTDATQFLAFARVELGDGDDSVSTTRPGPVPVGALVADGGSGDDHLEGGPNNDELDGGGGRDELLGGDSQDVLTDGDLDGASGGAAPGPDTLDGGAGRDEISYAQRTAAVRVDLVDPAGDGERDEGDTLRGFERITGGDGNDRLAGNGRGNTLDGGPGRNRLIGRGGDDELRRFGARGSVSCGRGADLVFDVRPRNFVEPACEAVVAGRGRVRLTFGAYPVRTRGKRLGFRVRCPFDEARDQFFVCSGRLTLREATGRHRLLAQATIPRSSRSRVVRVRLTALGRRLATRRRGVRAALAIRGTNLPTAGWTVRFAAPR